MSNLLHEVLREVFLEVPGFKTYAVCVVVLVATRYASQAYEGALRQAARLADPNATLDLMAFTALGLLAILAGAASTATAATLVVFTTASLVRAVALLLSRRRVGAWSTGVARCANLTLMALILIRVAR